MRLTFKRDVLGDVRVGQNTVTHLSAYGVNQQAEYMHYPGRRSFSLWTGHTHTHTRLIAALVGDPALAIKLAKHAAPGVHSAANATVRSWLLDIVINPI